MENKPDIREEIKKLADGNTDNSLNETLDLNSKITQLNIETYRQSEDQKIELRSNLTKAVKCIIWFQLIFFNIVVLLIVSSITIKIPFFKEIETNLSIRLFEFLKYYIGATIVELLGMLVFILHYVFSPYKLLEILKKNK